MSEELADELLHGDPLLDTPAAAGEAGSKGGGRRGGKGSKDEAGPKQPRAGGGYAGNKSSPVPAADEAPAAPAEVAQPQDTAAEESPGSSGAAAANEDAEVDGGNSEAAFHLRRELEAQVGRDGACCVLFFGGGGDGWEGEVALSMCGLTAPSDQTVFGSGGVGGGITVAVPMLHPPLLVTTLPSQFTPTRQRTENERLRSELEARRAKEEVRLILFLASFHSFRR